MPTPEEEAQAAAVRAAQATERAPIEIAAAEALAAAAARVASAEARNSTLEQRLSALEAKPAPAAPVAPEGLADVQRFMAKARDDRRIATAIAFGFDAKTHDGKDRYTRGQLLALIPDADPEADGGITKFEEHLQANATLYRAKGQTPQSVVAATSVQLDALGKKSALFSGARLAANMATGLKGRNK